MGRMAWRLIWLVICLLPSVVISSPIFDSDSECYSIDGRCKKCPDGDTFDGISCENNNKGSFNSNPCEPESNRTQGEGCINTPKPCGDGNICDTNARCKLTNEVYSCRCKVGWAGNGIVCGVDSDLDGWPDEHLNCSDSRCKKDNCAFIPNADQKDTDEDGIGNACDTDADGDGILNGADNCPLIHNADQKDGDEDSGDSIGDSCDNCPTVPNEDQIDTDNDGIGDACDEDIDNDGLLNKVDNCPRDKNVDQSDKDLDGIGDVCDNCPLVPNPSQEDENGDAIGDACESVLD